VLVVCLFFFLLQITGLGRTWSPNGKSGVFGSVHPKKRFGALGPLVGLSNADQSTGGAVNDLAGSLDRTITF